MTASDIVVLGAGPAGLAFAYRFGRNAVVLEKELVVGGLSRSIEILDGVFDIGGHSFHSPHPEVVSLVRSLMAGAWYEQPRDARIWVSGELIPYPFQHHFQMLGDRTIVEDCLSHEPDPISVAESTNFEEWIVRRFGNGIAQHFMRPYNQKLWACDLKEMSCEWVVERVATDKIDDASAETPTPARRPLQSDSRVGYPAEGGFGKIFEALAAHCDRIELSEEVVRIDLANRTVHTASGRVWPWLRIVSTMPIPQLLRCLSTCPDHIIEMSARLRAVSLKILLILARLHEKNLPQRVYISDPAIPPHKIAFNHTSSPSLQNRKHHAISCEVSYSPSKPAISDGEMLAGAVDWLKISGFIESSSDIVAQRVVDVPFGYPVCTDGNAAVLAEIHGYLENLGVYSIGRFGSWSYANSDECIRQGLCLAETFENELEAVRPVKANWP